MYVGLEEKKMSMLLNTSFFGVICEPQTFYSLILRIQSKNLGEFV